MPRSVHLPEDSQLLSISPRPTTIPSSSNQLPPPEVTPELGHSGYSLKSNNGGSNSYEAILESLGWDLQSAIENLVLVFPHSMILRILDAVQSAFAHEEALEHDLQCAEGGDTPTSRIDNAQKLGLILINRIGSLTVSTDPGCNSLADNAEAYRTASTTTASRRDIPTRCGLPDTVTPITTSENVHASPNTPLECESDSDDDEEDLSDDFFDEDGEFVQVLDTLSYEEDVPVTAARLEYMFDLDSGTASSPSPIRLAFHLDSSVERPLRSPPWSALGSPRTFQFRSQDYYGGDKLPRSPLSPTGLFPVDVISFVEAEGSEELGGH